MKGPSELSRAGNPFFVTGMLLGAACGFVIGSAVALRLGRSHLRAARRLLRRLLRREGPPVRHDLLV